MERNFENLRKRDNGAGGKERADNERKSGDDRDRKSRSRERDVN